MAEFKHLRLTLLIGLIYLPTFGQVKLPETPKPGTFQVITPNQYMPENIIPIPNVPTVTDFGQNNIQRRNQQLIRETELREQQRIEQQKQIYADLKTERINYSLPSKSNIPETSYYRNAFDQLSKLDPNNFSVKEATFLIENAYFEEQQNFEDFDKFIKQTGDFLREKMNELGYDPNSNLAKNFMLFQFFSDTLEIKSKDLKHLPFKYDFEDYMGVKDWSKMFVSKLLATGSGQCNSLPKLYLILAEEIGAEAFLSLSPNHSYIRFRDNEENWYNVELTNGMFTADSFILQSGYIKSEALLNEIYMQNLSSKQLLAQLLTGLAMGYVHKFGYDTFVKQVIDKALVLYPNLINARMVNSNYLTVQFEYATNQVGINPRNNQELQNIRYYPPLVQMLNQVNAEYKTIDDLGFEFMPADAYENWLNSLQETKQKQDNEQMKQQFKNVLNKPLKD